jgi:hypothetical protein
MENTFQVPVIESYGMTEAAHQMSSNPLPPRARKPGCVGLPAGPEVAILSEQGTLLEAGADGEIAIRGTMSPLATMAIPRPTPKPSIKAGPSPGESGCGLCGAPPFAGRGHRSRRGIEAGSGLHGDGIEELCAGSIAGLQDTEPEKLLE